MYDLPQAIIHKEWKILVSVNKKFFDDKKKKAGSYNSKKRIEMLTEIFMYYFPFCSQNC